MREILFVSDTHFDHANFLNFRDDAGRVIRDFADVDAMNECMIERWNKAVRPQDIVYHLGDVTFRIKDYARIASRLNGHKRLILGNHDDGRNYELLRWFEKVSLWRIFKEHNFVATHIPIPITQFRHKVQFNLHGHIHQNLMEEPWYINVCVEQINYTPISLDEVKARMPQL